MKASNKNEDNDILSSPKEARSIASGLVTETGKRAGNATAAFEGPPRTTVHPFPAGKILHTNCALGVQAGCGMEWT